MRRSSPRRPRLLRAFMLAVTMTASGWARDVVEIDYWLWDWNQFPAYRAAARAFEQQNPDIRIKLTTLGWDTYWISLTTALISETAPDVFWNHVTRYPQLLRNHTLLDLAPRVQRDGIDPQRYIGDLYAVWSKDGGQYGLPKDWDTIALVFNRAHLARAGVEPRDLDELDWNPRDGGSFGRMIARLSRDAAGENGLSPRFDPRRVVCYGLLNDGRPDGFGQTDWSHLAVSNGFRHCDGAWSQRFHYDDPRLAETIRWLRETSLERGFIVPVRDAWQSSGPGLFAAGRGSLAFVGSWMITWLQANCDFEIGFAPLPVGPVGRRTMFNGLADSVWSGTRHPEEAWRWVKFLGSREAQMIVADHGVVFPAIREAAERATEVMSARGADVSVYLREAVEPGVTFPFPMTDHGSDIVELTRIGMDRLFLQDSDIESVLRRMNREVNALFEQ